MQVYIFIHLLFLLKTESKVPTEEQSIIKGTRYGKADENEKKSRQPMIRIKHNGKYMDIHGQFSDEAVDSTNVFEVVVVGPEEGDKYSIIKNENGQVLTLNGDGVLEWNDLKSKNIVKVITIGDKLVAFVNSGKCMKVENKKVLMQKCDKILSDQAFTTEAVIDEGAVIDAKNIIIESENLQNKMQKEKEVDTQPVIKKTEEEITCQYPPPQETTPVKKGPVEEKPENAPKEKEGQSKSGGIKGNNPKKAEKENVPPKKSDNNDNDEKPVRKKRRRTRRRKKSGKPRSSKQGSKKRKRKMNVDEPVEKSSSEEEGAIHSKSQETNISDLNDDPIFEEEAEGPKYEGLTKSEKKNIETKGEHAILKKKISNIAKIVSSNINQRDVSIQ